MKDELIPVTLWLAGRSYRIRVKAEDEEAIRKSVKVADEKINELRRQYAGRDDQDFMAMCLLSYAADTAIDLFHHPLLQDEMEKMCAKIDAVLNSGATTE